MTIEPATSTIRRIVRGLSLPVLTLAVLACLSVSAQAERTHPLLLSELLPEGRLPFTLAVNQGTHHFYVVNLGVLTGGTHSILNYEDNGQIDLADPELANVPSFEPRRVAVDNSGGAAESDVYASDQTGNVEQYGPSGEATAVQITASAIPANGTPQAGGLPPVVNKGFRPAALAVGGLGNVFVVDYSSEAIDVFTPAGVFVKQVAAGDVGGFTGGIAVDASGDIYIANEFAPEGSPLITVSSPEGSGLFELDSSGDCVQTGCAPIDPAQIRGLALDASAGTIFTIGVYSGVGGFEGELREYETSTGKLLGVTKPKGLEQPYSLGVNEVTGEVIVPDEEGGSIYIYGPAEAVPDVKTLAPEGVGDGAVVLSGEVGAAGLSGATCGFQYATEEQFQTRGFEGAQEAACEPAGPFSGEAMNAVHARVEGLTGGTDYHERLVGTNGNGANAGEDVGFTTLGPTVGGGEVTEVSQVAATLKGTVDPDGSPASYRFEYLTQAQYEANAPSERFAGAVEAPAGGQAIGAGGSDVAVSQRVEGLAAGVAYRFRVVAVNGTGETLGEGFSFSTYALSPTFRGCPNEALRAGPAETLPDCRAYEQASPVNKNGADVQGGLNSVQASSTGDGITFFANTGIPGGEGGQEFPTYLATRAEDGSGWSTQGLLPPGADGSPAAVLGWTESLEDTYDFASKPSAEGMLLRRANTGGNLTRVAAIKAKNPALAFAGSSQDGAVALIESEAGALVPGKDREGEQNLYAYDREAGQLVVAGVLNPTTPGGEPMVPLEGAMAGSYEWLKGNPKVPGGALGHFFTEAQHAISADGAKVFFTAGGSGQLYVRENPLAPQSAMSGETCVEAGKACTVRVSAPAAGVAEPGTPAAFVGATPDGSVAYFLDKGKLTADATGGSGFDLYRYDVDTGETADMTRDSADKRGARVEGVLGIGGESAEAGENVYFVAAGALTAEASQAPSGETNLYALVDGQLRFVARLGTGVTEQRNWLPTTDQEGVEQSRTSMVSADGQTLLLRSSRQLTGYRNDGTPELYLYRVGQGLGCVSCDPSGQAPAGSAGVQEIPPVGTTLRRYTSFLTRNLSANGRRVFFDSPDRLVIGDENNVNDVYEWEAKGEGSCDEEAANGGCLFLISSGAKNAGPSWFGDADEEGENVFFFTSQSLVAQDKDQLVDVYDARVDGGIAGQEQLPPVPCESETACHSTASAQPALSAPGTFSFIGSGNLLTIGPVSPTKAKPQCKKGQALKHGKCTPVCKKGRTLKQGKCTRVQKRAKTHKVNKRKHHPTKGKAKRHDGAKGGGR